MSFDIILPTICRESLVGSIESVLEQTIQDWHLWVIADGIRYEDVKLQLIYDPRITYLYLPTKYNDCGATPRNVGIHHGVNDWIIYLDDDDRYFPNHIETFQQLINKYPENNMFKTAGQSFSMRHKHPRSKMLVEKNGPINSTDILTVGMCHTREIFEKTYGWGDDPNKHDAILWNDMLLAGGKCFASDIVTFKFLR